MPITSNNDNSCRYPGKPFNWLEKNPPSMKPETRQNKIATASIAASITQYCATNQAFKWKTDAQRGIRPAREAALESISKLTTTRPSTDRIGASVRGSLTPLGLLCTKNATVFPIIEKYGEGMGTAASTLWLTTYEGHMDPGAKALSGTKKVKCIASAGPAVMAREAIYYKALLNGPEKAQEISKDLTGKELPIGPARAISGFTMGVLTAFPDNLATQARGFFMQNPTQFNLAKLTKTGFRGTVSRGVYGAAVSLSFLSAKNSAMMAMEEVQP